jgi:Arc/MetJ-type ribon-helix-helix transcriptional regulator
MTPATRRPQEDAVPLGDDTKSTIRLGDDDRRNVEAIIASGAASNIAEAIRVALAEYARLVPRMRAIERRVREIPPNPMGGYEIEQLLDLLKTDGVDRLASEELLRRGYFPDGLGHWVENRPDATVRVPSAPIKRGPPGRPPR